MDWVQERLEETVEQVLASIWRLLLRLCRWLWPIHAYHQWSQLHAGVMLKIPGSSAKASLRIFQITDPHLSEELDVSERNHAERMHAAFRVATSIWNGSSVQPISVFRDLVDLAASSGADMVALTGDTVNFPQQRSVNWVVQTLNSSLRVRSPGVGREREIAADAPRIPFVHTAGNHDWFYEGSEASQWELRRRWRVKSMLPLYEQSWLWNDTPSAGSTRSSSIEGDGIDCAAREFNGVLLVTIDNSFPQVTAAQLRFFRSQVLRWIPMVLMLHIPLSVTPELRPFHGFALCGDPAWGEATDRSWQVERRKAWPGHSNRATQLFLEAVQDAAAPQGPLVAVLTGHVHMHDATPFGHGVWRPADGNEPRAWGAVQYIGLPAFQGGFRVLDIGTIPDDGGAPAEGVSVEQTLDSLMRESSKSKELLDGFAHALAAGTWPFAPLCWRDAPARGVGIVDTRWVEAAVDTMLRRTAAFMRVGFRELARALRPLLEHFREDLCGGALVKDVLETALSEWADPAELIYVPGQQLAFGSDRSIFARLNKAVGALKREGDWGGFGEHMGFALWITARKLPPYLKASHS